MTVAGLQITTQDTRTMPQATRLILPSTLNSGLVSLSLLTDGLTAATRQWVSGAANSAQGGTPVAGTGYCSLTGGGAGYFTTAVNDQSLATLLVVVRATSGSPFLLGSFAGASLLGSSIFKSAGSWRISANFNGAAVQAIDTAADDGSWQCLIGSVDAPGSTPVNFYNMTKGRSAASGASTGARVTNGGPYRLGSEPSNTFTGATDEAIGIVWNRVLTSGERTSAYNWAKSVMASFSTPIVI